ncbi:hypothetical protein GF377_07595, partial [candidate division GN15 bacterium]|nr:hypothetical protein [candidate division GN15 bacterium]
MTRFTQQTTTSSVKSAALFVPLVLAAALLLSLPAATQAQFYFGKNKVQYASFDWQVMTTEHFRIYFYEDEAEIAKVAARIAEDAYRPLAKKFNHEWRRRVPLIIYSAPRYFAQTNVVPGLLPESVGGFTEFMKGRVVVPFHGSYFDFKHVIVHEMVHVFMLSKLAHEMDKQRRARAVYPPLWFTEGIAEFWSESWDTEADMIIKDMVIQGRLPRIPDFWRFHGSYFMYKLGQAVCEFIEAEYGSDKLTYIFDNWSRGRDFDHIIELSLGDNLEELSRKWEYSLKKRYFPQMADYDLPAMESKRITRDGYSLKGVPIDWDNGEGETEWIVYMAHRLGYAGIYLKPRKPTTDGRQTLVKGERSIKFESLHLLRSGIDATDSGLVVFSSKSKDRDVVYIYDLNQMKITREFPIDELVSVRSPQFSPDHRTIVFTGIRRSGYADLFELTMATGDVRALTNDIYNDIDPTYSDDGERVVFASDRCEGGNAGATNLYELDLTTKALRQLTWGDFNDQTPDVTERGIFFSSDREDSYNLFLLADDGSITRQSTYVTGAFDPRLSP